MTSRIRATAVGLVALAGGTAAAQTSPPSDSGVPPPDAELVAPLAAVRACTQLAETGRLIEAKSAGTEAEVLLGRYLARRPRQPDALVALARAMTQCLLPAADFVGQGELSTRAIELLEQALEVDPLHWSARFVLANILLRSPSFLGRAPRAAEQLDILLRQQGERREHPTFARVYELRGILFSRDGQTDSARALWARGAALFPTDTALARLAQPPVTRPPEPAAALATQRVVTSSIPPSTAIPHPSVRVISRSQVLMVAGGAADVMQGVQMQPGATRVTEGSDVYTRGGDASETALVLNGGRVLTLSRFEGLHGGQFGVIDPFLVRWIRYSSGAFSVRHGNALSGVLEIETEGRPRERQLHAGASLVQLSGMAGLPMSRTIGGWLSARLSHTGALLATHGRTGEFDGAPYSGEVLASMVAAPSAMTEWRATALVARDDSRRVLSTGGWTGPFHSAGESRAVQVSSRWLAPSVPVVLRANVTGSSRTGDWEFGVLAREGEEVALVSRVDAEWARSEAMTIRVGIEQATLARDERATLPITASVAADAPSREALSRARARGGGAYLETEHLRGSTSLILGLRVDRLPGERRTTFDPRVTLATRTGPWAMRLSGGVFHQGSFRATLPIPDAGRPSGTARIATQVVAGVERAGLGTIVRLEAFVKRYGDYTEQRAGPRSTAGTARGIDLAVHSAAGARLTGWLGYSLLDATVRLVDGRTVRSPADVTHSLTASATLRGGTDWSLGSTFRYGTGAPLTPIIGGEERDGRLVPRYGVIMSERLPAYQRLDARLMRFIRAERFLVTSYVEVLNISDRPNAASVTYDAAYRRSGTVDTFFASRTVVAGCELQFR
jgi:hypothetical protein